MTEKYNRHIRLKSVTNLRDIGGYKARNGKTIVWRRIFRSGEFAKISRQDFQRLTQEISITTVIDLRSKFEVERQGIGLINEANIKYHNIAFITDDDDPKANERRYKDLKNMGEFYIEQAQQKEYGKHIIEALEVIAEPENHPLVFHCAVGKDRTGMLAAILLNLLGVGEDDIIQDYTLSEPYMDELLARLKNNPQKNDPPLDIPEYFWKASPESMKLFLNTLRQEYGSIEGYLESMGSADSLAGRLKAALLV